ncbi:hypothetical protein Pcinc_042241 [Petrolisthes cinctipes]|uniref:Uncharacterized protein n=1 Tax=Petrolisthes cinctipes TaxID=88211 RepID=A0AAE1EG64_PETCI|nr:hypothetical protein Pcinc_042241 [Petrolisthes cinctipes]
MSGNKETYLAIDCSVYFGNLLPDPLTHSQDPSRGNRHKEPFKKQSRIIQEEDKEAGNAIHRPMKRMQTLWVDLSKRKLVCQAMEVELVIKPALNWSSSTAKLQYIDFGDERRPP